MVVYRFFLMGYFFTPNSLIPVSKTMAAAIAAIPEE